MNQNNINNRRTTYKREGGKLPSVNDVSDIVLPPAANGEDQSLYDCIVKPNGLNGTERFFSVPDTGNKNCSFMKQYLKSFYGKNVCIVFWGHPGNKFEKCGELSDVGDDYISIKEQKSGSLIITNIEKIKYISVFCI